MTWSEIEFDFLNGEWKGRGTEIFREIFDEEWGVSFFFLFEIKFQFHSYKRICIYISRYCGI